MDEARLKTKIFVQALLRRVMSCGAFGAVVTSGDDDAGAIVLKINGLENGCVVLTQIRLADGQRAWMKGTGDVAVSDSEAELYIERQRRYDSDLWVVEIEDRQGRAFVDDPVI